jgi:hypothetical protein
MQARAFGTANRNILRDQMWTMLHSSGTLTAAPGTFGNPLDSFDALVSTFPRTLQRQLRISYGIVTNCTSAQESHYRFTQLDQLHFVLTTSPADAAKISSVDLPTILDWFGFYFSDPQAGVSVCKFKVRPENACHLSTFRNHYLFQLPPILVLEYEGDGNRLFNIPEKDAILGFEWHLIAIMKLVSGHVTLQCIYDDIWYFYDDGPGGHTTMEPVAAADLWCNQFPRAREIFTICYASSSFTRPHEFTSKLKQFQQRGSKPGHHIVQL